jgi:outer membrane lipoprotein SlyB
MENVQGKARLHPLVAGAAAAVIVASAVGVAAVGGYLPGSKAEQQDRAAVGKTSADTRKAANARGATRVAAACTECGVVVGVKEETVMGKGTGVGAVAGGVAGAVIGHEIGDGSRAGTAVGAVVGGVAGHQIERSARSTKRYDISVRMHDGSIKVVSSDTPPAWRPGDKVRLQNGLVKPL